MTESQSSASQAGARSPSYPIRSVERVCDILDFLRLSRGGASLQDVAEAANLPKSSAFRYLTVLESRNYVQRDDQSARYRVGLAFEPRHVRQLESLVRVARPVLERLRDSTGETTNLGTLNGPVVVHELVVESRQMMRLAARVGDLAPVHSTAMGKSLAASLPKERVEALLSVSDMTAFTDRTLTSLENYLDALVAVKTTGYALDECENQPDGRCVAVALVGVPFPCAISVSAPAARFRADQVPAVAEQLFQAASEIVDEYTSQQESG